MDRKGFSLVELSIVLAIIGLVVGGVMVGSNLIRSAEVRGVITMSQQYKDAMLAFRSKYSAWPGDMSDATSYWGIRDGATGNDATCFDAGTPAGSTGTCNGNGDGIIYSNGGTYINERPQTWQHLAYAGLIEGQYDGYYGTIASSLRRPGANMPTSHIQNSYFESYTKTPQSGHLHYFDNDSYHTGVHFGSTTGFPLTPEEAWNIDLKVDDGKPGTGSIWTFKATSTWGPNCANDDNLLVAEYNVSIKTRICSINIDAE